MSTLSIIVIVVQLATSIWVFVDAISIGLNKQAKYGHFTRMRDTGPVGWFVACLLLWVICFPLYLIRRGKHLAKVKNDALGNRGVVSAQCPSCGLDLSITPDLFGQVVVCPTCQFQFAAPQPYRQSWYEGAAPVAVGYVVYAVGLACLAFAFLGGAAMTPKQLESEVKKNIQETFSKHADTIGTQIMSFSLVHESGNKYKGLLVVQTGDKSETAEVDVTYDGRTFMWKIVPNTAQALSNNQADSAPASPNEVAVRLQTKMEKQMTEVNDKTRIHSMNLVYNGGNNYSGTFEMGTSDPKVIAYVDATYDGKALDWKITRVTKDGHDIEWKTKGSEHKPASLPDATPVQSFLKLSRDAASGDISSQLNLGVVYYDWCKNFLEPTTDRNALKEVLKTADFDITRTDIAIRKELGERAMQVWTQTAERGNADAQLKLGAVFLEGVITPKNPDKAIEWIRKAAEQGNMDAQAGVGTLLYQSGKYSESLKWLQRAAEQGDGGSSYQIGAYYQLQRTDVIEGYRWFLIAVSQGAKSGVAVRDALEKVMTASQIAEATRRAGSFKLAYVP